MKRSTEKEKMIEEGITHDSRGSVHEHSDIRGDEKNIVFLFFLYLLQGIPIGISNAIPMLLQNRHVSYKQQAEFSFVNWPFSLKLLWAPIVDSIFIYKFGRRKTWLIPVQMLIGIFMLVLSGYVGNILGGDGESLDIGLLTIVFFSLNVLAATQDIVVDGWALTMLKRCNVGYASTCNTVGQTAGFFLGFVVFLALESADFCNSYLRSEPSNVGMTNLPSFLYFWGLVFISTTVFVAFFKKENPEKSSSRGLDNMNIKDAYLVLLQILQLPSIKMMVVLLLTAKIGFSACDAVTSLKLIEAGVAKENIALMVVPLVPLNIILPLIISKYTVGPKPLNIYLKAMPYRLIFGLLSALLVFVTPFIIRNGHVPYYFYAVLIIIYLLHQVTTNSMFVAVMAFFAKISDPSIGGTYMTLLNTLCNLGGNWPATVALWLVDPLTVKQCSTDPQNDCSSTEEQEMCAKTDNGVCNIKMDGYYIESILCFIIGFVWLRWAKRKVQHLQRQPMSQWKVFKLRR